MTVKKIVIVTIGVIIFALAIGFVVYSIMIGKPKPDGPNPIVDKDMEVLESEKAIFTSYSDYKLNISNKERRIDKDFSDDIASTDFDNYNVAVITVSMNGCGEVVKDIKSNTSNNVLNVNYYIAYSCGVCAKVDYVIVKKINKDVKSIKTYYKVTSRAKCNRSVDYKPLIYIYPTEDMDLTVKLGNTELLTHSYPLYKDAWNVHVTKDGNIYDYDTKRNYYGLYWEAYDEFKPDMKTGFVVEGKETIKLLEEKLEVLGLNEREINEFIIYWIDKLENNKYNYLYFRTTDEVNKAMPLEFSKDPDTLIRVLVDIVPLDEKIEVNEQVLTPVTRTGYTVVEWGGNIHENI